MKFFSFIFSLLLFISSLLAEPLPDGEQIIVRLSTDVQLMPLHIEKIKHENSPFPSDYLNKLEAILEFDLNHNGMTYRETSKKKAFYTVQLTIKENKTLSAVIESKNGNMGKNIDGLVLSGNLNKDRRQMHQLADAIHKVLFDKEGIATTRILYTIKKRNKENTWVSEIWEADYDGENSRCIINNNSFNLSPVYIPSTRGNKCSSFLYVSYKVAQPKIFVGSLADGSSARFCTMRGNQHMPVISKQRDKVAFISDITSNPDLFLQPFHPEKGLQGKPFQIFAAKQATQGSPSFDPEGNRIAFVSNKDGSPRVYVMTIPKPGAPINEISTHLVTKHSRESSAPAWSPDGSKLAYCALTNGIRQIWIYDFNTKEERQLTQGPGNKENPTWAPNSLSIMFNSSDRGACDLYLINLNQPKATKITTGPGEKRFPNWEPR